MPTRTFYSDEQTEALIAQLQEQANEDGVSALVKSGLRALVRQLLWKDEARFKNKQDREAGIPIVTVLPLSDGRFLLPNCPFCGRDHSHGAGKTKEDWTRLQGYRASHCAGPWEIHGHYYLRMLRAAMRRKLR